MWKRILLALVVPCVLGSCVVATPPPPPAYPYKVSPSYAARCPAGYHYDGYGNCLRNY